MVNSYPSTFSQLRRWSSDLHPDLKKYLTYALAVLFVYALLVGCRITTSHTGLITGNSSEKSTILLGQPRQERSDEVLRGSPLVIASLRDIPPSFKTQLELTNFVQATGEVSMTKRFSSYIQTPEVLLNRLLTATLPFRSQ